jgi:hypothetical protein
VAARARQSNGVSSSSESVRLAGTPVRGASVDPPFGKDVPPISGPVLGAWVRWEREGRCWGVALERHLGHEAGLWAITAWANSYRSPSWCTRTFTLPHAWR